MDHYLSRQHDTPFLFSSCLLSDAFVYLDSTFTLKWKEGAINESFLTASSFGTSGNDIQY